MKSSVGLYYQLIVTDKKTGKIISKTAFKRSKSFVKQFLQILEANMFPSVNIANVKDIGNVDRDLVENSQNGNFESPVGNTNYGITVGTGTTAPTNIDYVMETLIAHGVGAGQLSYGVQSKTTTDVVGANVDMILTRTFTNSSGGTINVTEAGMQMIAMDDTVTARWFLVTRDTFAAVAVNNGQVLTVTYTIRTTV